jgi:hypothetical protein
MYALLTSLLGERDEPLLAIRESLAGQFYGYGVSFSGVESFGRARKYDATQSSLMIAITWRPPMPAMDYSATTSNRTASLNGPRLPVGLVNSRMFRAQEAASGSRIASHFSFTGVGSASPGMLGQAVPSHPDLSYHPAAPMLLQGSIERSSSEGVSPVVGSGYLAAVKRALMTMPYEVFNVTPPLDACVGIGGRRVPIIVESSGGANFSELFTERIRRFADGERILYITGERGLAQDIHLVEGRYVLRLYWHPSHGAQPIETAIEQLFYTMDQAW